MITSPARDGPSVAATRSCTTPGPVPLGPLVMVIHAARLSAVHTQPADVDTGTSREPPDGSRLNAVAPIEYLQLVTGAGPCSISTSWPATIKVPVRETLPAASTWNATAPFP